MANPILEDVTRLAMAIGKADAANVQLVTEDGLVIAASENFDADFLNFFALVNDRDSACGDALASGAPVIVEDVETSPIFAGKASGTAMLQAGSLSVASFPLVADTGKLTGMLSVHRRRTGAFSANEIEHLKWLARQAQAAIRQAPSAISIRTIEMLAQSWGFAPPTTKGWHGRRSSRPKRPPEAFGQTRVRAFKPTGSWTLVELLKASADVWLDLAEVEDDASVAVSFRAMAGDLTRFARLLASDAAVTDGRQKADRTRLN